MLLRPCAHRRHPRTRHSSDGPHLRSGRLSTRHFATQRGDHLVPMIPGRGQHDGESACETQEKEQNGGDLAHSLSPYLSTANAGMVNEFRIVRSAFMFLFCSSVKHLHFRSSPTKCARIPHAEPSYRWLANP